MRLRAASALFILLQAALVLSAPSIEDNETDPEEVVEREVVLEESNEPMKDVEYKELKEEDEPEMEMERRRIRCKCPPLNRGLQCKKKGQKRSKFYYDNTCKCPHFRCIWSVCPPKVAVNCRPCEDKQTVDDCGCRSYKCVPKVCKTPFVKCKKCEDLQDLKDKCGCTALKCAPKQNPPSQCGKCNVCEECKAIDSGEAECGLKELVCKRKECPPFKEIKCGPCDTIAFGEDRCGCPSMKCIKREPKPPTECPACKFSRKITNKQCGFDEYECTTKPCAGPPEGREECFTKKNGKKGTCGCPVYEEKECHVVPSGVCEKGSFSVGGIDKCGCPHKICTPCSKSYPRNKCGKCEIEYKLPRANGRCEEIICEKNPDCENICDKIKKMKQERTCGKCQKLKKTLLGPKKNGCVVKVCMPDTDNPACRPCLKPNDPKCANCKKPKTITTADGCPTKICVPSEEPRCQPPPPCPNETSCKKCEVLKRTKIGDRCYGTVCVPSDAPACGKCPKISPPRCRRCEVLGPVKLSDGCTVKACVPSNSVACSRCGRQPVPKCSKCQVISNVKVGSCIVKSCVPKSLKNCPPNAIGPCPGGQEKVTIKDACGCPKYSCKPKKCTLPDRKPISCTKGCKVIPKYKSKPCVFPFKYKNVVYTSCTNANNHNQPWCSTKTSNGNHVRGNWGICDLKTCQEETTFTVAKDEGGCPVKVCVDKPLICEGNNPYTSAFGQMVLKVEKGSGKNVKSIFAEGGPGVKSGNVKAASDLRKPCNCAWEDRAAVHAWNSLFSSGKKTKVRFTMWKRSPEKIEPVVDIIFNGKNSNIKNWFTKGRVLEVIKGPNVKNVNPTNYFSVDGHNGVGRHFYINRNYGGCNVDKGWIVVSDTKREACAGQWLGGKGWEKFPRFLYAKNDGGCQWRDANCVGEADVLTISLL